MGIANYANLAAVNTSYQTAWTELYGAGPPGTWQLVAEKYNVNAQTLALPIITSFPRMNEWTASKVYKDVRAYLYSIPLRYWSAAIRLQRRQVDYDPVGVTAKTIANFMRQSQFAYDDLFWTSLLANPTGFDGVSLLNDAHGNQATGATADNLETAAITYELFRSSVAKLGLMQDEDGRPLGIRATDLFVGPQLRRKALEITGAVRPIAVSTAGAYDATAAVQGAAPIPNGLAGEVNVHEVGWITGNQWFLFDLSKPAARPMLCVEGRAPTMIPVVDPASAQRFNTDEFLYGIETDVNMAAGNWQLAVGSVSA